MISTNDVKKLAALARIKLTAEEEEKLAKDMESILGYVKQIKEVAASLTTPEKTGDRRKNAECASGRFQSS